MKLGKALAILTAGTLLFTGCSAPKNDGSAEASGPSGSPASIVVAGFGGTFTDIQRTAYYEPFTSETGIAIVEAETGIASLQSQVNTGNVQWDVAMLSTADLALGVSQDLFENISGVVDPEDFIEGTVTDYGIGVDLSSNVMAWNSETAGDNAPEAWTDFWDLEKYPGKRAIPAWGPDAQLFEFALLADGVAMEDLYPLDVERALNKISEIRDSFIIYESNAQGLQLVTGGQAAMGILPNGRVELASRSSMPIAFTFNEGALATDWMAIPKGAKNSDAAKEFIQFVTQVEQQQEFLKQIPYAGTNLGSLEGLTPSVLKTLPTNDEAISVQFRPDAEYYAAEATSLTKQWQNFLYG